MIDLFEVVICNPHMETFRLVNRNTYTVRMAGGLRQCI